jgi:hypothetical protein
MSQRTLRASALGGLCALGLLSSSATAQCTLADAYENNDDCANAAVLTTGLLTGLTLQGPFARNGEDPDFFRVTVPAGDTLRVAVLFSSQASTDLDLHFYDPFSPSCGDKASAMLASTSNTDNELLVWTNSTPGALDVVFAVTAEAGESVICTTYDLDVSIGPDPCSQGVATDDALEENDACGLATTLAGNGAWTDLFVSPTDIDYYSTTVQPGEVFHAEIWYDAAIGQLGMEAYDDLSCVNSVGTSSWGGYDSVLWMNSTAAAVDVTYRVFVQQGERCNNYDMSLSVGPDPCVAATDDAFAPNSTCQTAATLTAGTYTDLYVSGWTVDCFKINAPAGNVLTVDVTYPTGLNTDLGVRLFSDSACLNQIEQSYWGGHNTVSTGSGSTVAQEYWVRVATGLGSGCNAYDINVSFAPDPCLTATDDAFEENDSCGSPSLLQPGAYTNLLASESDPDYYELVLQAGERLIADLSYPAGQGADLRLTIDDFGCANMLDNGGFGDGSHVEWANFGALPVSVVLSVETQDTSNGSCSSYDLIASVIIDPCLSMPDDTFEENDDCASAAVITEGLHQDLYVHQLDADYYLVNVLQGDTLNVTMDYDDGGASVRLYLYEPVPQNGGACGDGSSYLAQGFGPSQSKSISWINNLASGTYVIAVEVSAFSNSDCTTYSLAITGGGESFATPICFGDGLTDAGNGPTGCPCGNNSPLGAGEGCLNSTGLGATLNVLGSNIFALDNLSFTIDQARPNQPSLLIQGNAHVALPFKDGILCMGNPTERVEVVILDAAGSGTTVSSIVTEGNVPGPGNTRYYQAWYRDPGGVSPCGNGSNFTQGLRIDWI